MSEVASPDFWRRCSSCKTPIKYSSPYFVCSVSTCNRKRIGYVFDSIHCWERHLPGARHRDAAAVEARSPSLAEWQAELASDPSPVAAATGVTPTGPAGRAPIGADARAPQRVMVRPAAGTGPIAGSTAGAGAAGAPKFKDSLESEILIVVSKLKNYVRERSEMNTSDSVANVLSDRVRRLCDRAIEKARAEGRKTVMDRDFEF